MDSRPDWHRLTCPRKGHLVSSVRPVGPVGGVPVKTLSLSTAIQRPICTRCGTRMMLARIEPEGKGFETRSYECPKCEHVQIERVATDIDPLKFCKGWLSSRELRPPS